MITNDNNITELREENPFRSSRRIQRSPIRSVTPLPIINRMGDDVEHLERLKIEEEKAFVSLGNKLSAMNTIVCDARNIHKTVKDNLMQAVALYQQIRENREAIALGNILDATQGRTEIPRISKATQTERESTKDSSKRAASLSPARDKLPKKVRTSQPAEKGVTAENTTQWITVERKAKRSRNTRKRDGEKLIGHRGETLTIKTDGSSYANVLKEMKTTIKPEEIGIGIKKIRKTKEGNVLVEMTKGEGQAIKLENAIKGSFGDNIQVQRNAEKFLLDIRDMEETTDEKEIISSILDASNGEDANNIKVCNIRDYYGGTKQALFEVPVKVAMTILKGNRIKVGLVICRVRRKIVTKRCFRCMESGHIARSCHGKDRSRTCRRCGIDGHKSNECKSEPRCIICLEAGRQSINHYIGSSSSCR